MWAYEEFTLLRIFLQIIDNKFINTKTFVEIRVYLFDMPINYPDLVWIHPLIGMLIFELALIQHSVLNF